VGHTPTCSDPLRQMGSRWRWHIDSPARYAGGRGCCEDYFTRLAAFAIFFSFLVEAGAFLVSRFDFFSIAMIWYLLSWVQRVEKRTRNAIRGTRIHRNPQGVGIGNGQCERNWSTQAVSLLVTSPWLMRSINAAARGSSYQVKAS
jgi:hypothetical protein